MFFKEVCGDILQASFCMRRAAQGSMSLRGMRPAHEQETKSLHLLA